MILRMNYEHTSSSTAKEKKINSSELVTLY
jgi:hypothetical protein